MSLCDPDAELRCGTLDCSEPDIMRDEMPWDALEQSVFGAQAKQMRSVKDIQVRCLCVVCVPVCACVYACVHMRVLHVSAFRVFVCVSACLSVYVSLCVCCVREFDKSRLNESHPLAAPASICLSSRLSVYLFVCLCLFLSTLFPYFCMSVSVSVSV